MTSDTLNSISRSASYSNIDGSIKNLLTIIKLFESKRSNWLSHKNQIWQFPKYQSY